MTEIVSQISLPDQSQQNDKLTPFNTDIAKKMIVHLKIGFHQICVVTAILPLVTLLSCFVSAYVFQSEEVHETHCRVYNIIPSISAITGVSPQRYFWRICIALHIGPRFIIVACYRNYYLAKLKRIIHKIDVNINNKIRFLINLVFCLSIIEITALCGVTYVSNKENYPLHEKIFIIFMTCSLCYMLATIRLCETIQSIKSSISTDQQQQQQQFVNGSSVLPPATSAVNLYSKQDDLSLKWKKTLFLLSILSTIGLILFFLKHRLYCHDMAFSWFALCEYFIATANMAFHCTTMLDFPNEYLIIMKHNNELDESSSPIMDEIDSNYSNDKNSVSTISSDLNHQTYHQNSIDLKKID